MVQLACQQLRLICDYLRDCRPIGSLICAGAAPKGAWKAIWGSFCSAMQGSGRGNEEPAAKDDDKVDGQQLWQDLVRWHAEVRKRDRERLAERYAMNLEAASLPPLKSLQPLEAAEL